MTSEQYRLLAEVRAELAMRRKVWRRIPGSHDKFVDSEHQRKYDIMTTLEGILDEMTTRELFTITDRIERKKSEKNAQSNLFDDP